jgi:hypothetical protein
MARPKKKASRQYKTVGIYASIEWTEWLEKMAQHYRTTVAGLVDRALSEWAQTNGYPERPPLRVR